MFTRKALYTAMLATALTACGSSSSDDNDDNANSGGGSNTAPATTTFKVAVDAPTGMQDDQAVTANQPWYKNVIQAIAPEAHADEIDNLSQDNFVITILSPDGSVLEVVEPVSFSKEPDGTYNIVLPGGARLDCVVIVDVNGAPSVTVNSPLPADLLVAPTTATDVDVSLASTAALNTFIDKVQAILAVSGGDTFEAAGFDATNPEIVAAVEELLNEVEEAVADADEPDFTNGGTIADFLTSVETIADAVVDTIVSETINASEDTLADFAGPGLNWFWSETEFDEYTQQDAAILEYGVVSQDTGNNATDTLFEINGSTFVENTNNHVDVEGYVLTANGWATDYDHIELVVSNGAVSIHNINTEVTQNMNGTVINAVGLSAASYLIANDSHEWAALLSDSFVFAADAQVASVDFTAAAASVTLSESWLKDAGGNWGTATFASMDDFIMDAGVTYSADTSNAAEIAYFGNNESIWVSLLDDDTARYFTSDGTTGPAVLATSAYTTVTSNGVTYYQLALPATVTAMADAKNADDPVQNIIAYNAGNVWSGNATEAGDDNGSEYLFNAAAAEQIITAVESTLQSQAN